MLLNVAPHLSPHDVRDCGVSDPELCCQLHLRTETACIAQPNTTDIRLSQPRVGMTISPRTAFRMPTGSVAITKGQCFGLGSRSMPFTAGCMSLDISVPYVVCRSTQKQMIRSHTRRVVTVMANMHTRGYGAVGQSPCNPMSGNFSAVDRKVAIALQVSSSRPFPATPRLLSEVSVESFTDGPARSLIAGECTKQTALFRSSPKGKLGAAMGAGTSFDGMLGTHREASLPGVAPRVVPPTPWLSRALILPFLRGA
jgi:hypothetical protein